VTLKKTLAGVAVSACATVALMAAGVPAAQAYYYNPCTKPTDLEVCITNQQHVASLFAVPNVGTNTVHVADAVAYVDVYRVPNTSIGVPCVVATANATSANPCANLGLVYDATSPRIWLVSGPVDGATPTILPTPLAQVDICTGVLNANYNGIGINDQTIVTVCVDSNALTMNSDLISELLSRLVPTPVPPLNA
jgi:hypothetical protein